MRVLMAVVALAVTPFIAGVAQGNHARKVVARHANATSGSANGCQQQGQHDGNNEGCGTAALLGAISGTVFFDMSYDGVRDPLTEPGIPDWTILLGGAVTATVLSDASGNYLFPNLPAGTYQVCEAQRYAWLQTAPQGSGCAAGFGYTIVLAAGQVLTGQDFGNVR